MLPYDRSGALWSGQMRRLFNGEMGFINGEMGFNGEIGAESRHIRTRGEIFLAVKPAACVPLAKPVPAVDSLSQDKEESMLVSAVLSGLR